jgi:hypothetical protein
MPIPTHKVLAVAKKRERFRNDSVWKNDFPTKHRLVSFVKEQKGRRERLEK